MDNFGCLQKMTQLVGMIEDFNRVGRIFAYGLICADNEDDVDLDCINIQDVAIECDNTQNMF